MQCVKYKPTKSQFFYNRAAIRQMYTEKPLVTINCCESSSAHNRVTYAEGAAVAPGPVAKNIQQQCIESFQDAHTMVQRLTKDFF